MRTVLVAALAVGTVALGLSGANAYSDHQQAVAAAIAIQQQQRSDAAAAAWTQFMELYSVDPGAGFSQHATEYARAQTPADFQLLQERWRLETDVARLDLAYLADSSGGLEGGVPHDIAELGRSIASAAAAAAGLGISTDPAPDMARRLDSYVALPAAERLAQHEEVHGELTTGLETLTSRVDARREATNLAARLDDLVALAANVGIPDALAQQVADARALSARATGDQDVRAADQQLQAVTAALNGIVNRTPGAPLPPCLTGAQPSHLIWIHLASQQLVAYQDGCPWLATPVTTGRPALPTDRGTFSIFYKTYAYKMISPWPLGSPFYYPPTWVYYAMEFVGDGTFIHNADWQPDGSYGPGSQYGPYASHGCVHVRDAVLPSLYAWAPVGTTVIVGD